jgi:hypothetical protein
VIESVVTKAAAALAAMAVLASGAAVFGAYLDRAAADRVRSLAEALAHALDDLSRSPGPGRVLLTGDNGALPGMVRGRPFRITFEAARVAVADGEVEAWAALAHPIHLDPGFGTPWVVGSEVPVWAVREFRGGALETTLVLG